MFGTGPVEVRVEPTSRGKWLIRKDGITQGLSTNYKKDAIEKARKIARRENGTLTVLNRDMDVSETRSYV